MRWWRATGRVLVLGGVLLALAACGTQSGSGTPAPSASGPVGLIGLWRVEGAAGVPADQPSVLRLASGELSWWRACGVAFGSWRADGGLLLLDAGQSSTGSCPATGEATSTTWLQRVARYAPDGSGWRLLDASGQQVARLAPGATLTPGPDLAPSLAAPPTADAAARAAFAEPVPLPTSLRPATPTTTAGRWELGEPSSGRLTGKPPFLAISPDGSWTGWDGCNGASGRWLVGAGGRLLVTAGPRTLIGCEGVDLPALWATTARVGTDAGRLVLVDAGGRELVRLQGPRVVASITHGPVQR